MHSLVLCFLCSTALPCDIRLLLLGAPRYEVAPAGLIGVFWKGRRWGRPVS